MGRAISDAMYRPSSTPLKASGAARAQTARIAFSFQTGDFEHPVMAEKEDRFRRFIETSGRIGKGQCHD